MNRECFLRKSYIKSFAQRSSSIRKWRYNLLLSKWQNLSLQVVAAAYRATGAKMSRMRKQPLDCMPVANDFIAQEREEMQS
jgi:hypothetical protein